MAADSLAPEDLLSPIAPDRPAGEPFEYSEGYYRIKNARKSDRPEDVGGYERLDGFKTADFEQVRELCEQTLREKSKDLQTAVWLTEANLRTRGFPGLGTSLTLLRELLERDWESLSPDLSEGLETRSVILEWLNEKLAAEVRQLPLTVPAQPDGEGLAYVQYADSRIVGSKADCTKPNGDLDEKRFAIYKQQVEKDGRTPAEAWDEALSRTSPDFFENLLGDLEQVLADHEALSQVCEEKFGAEAAPALSEGKQALLECRDLIQRIVLVNRKNAAGPAAEAEEGGVAVVTSPAATPLPSSAAEAGGASEADWQAAQNLIRQGRIDEGVVEMRRLAAKETTGRARFQRKLFLAEVCLSSNRLRLARLILEELHEQIDKLQLQDWEGPELIGRVWSKLYQTYRKGEGGDQTKADQLYQRLCRLDPWQAYSCGE